MSISEMDNAVPQGKGVWRIGVAVDAPLSREGNDTLATRKGIIVEDKSQKNRFSGKIHLRYGLDDNTDLSLTTWYATFPGLGIRASMKRSFAVSTNLRAALFGSIYHFSTFNEIPYWEFAKNTYNRSISGLTVGTVASLLLSRDNVISDDAISAGAKLSVNFARIGKETEYFSDPFSTNPPPPPEFRLLRETYYVTTPFVGVSIGSSQKTTYYLEGSLPLAFYDGFESTGPLYGQVSFGVLIRLFDSAQD